MKRFAVRNTETQIDHIIYDRREDAESMAREMTDYHCRKYEVVEVCQN